MSRYRLSRHWDIQGHDEVAEELGKALAAFGVQKAAAEGEFTASLRHLKTFGRHPEELPRWGPYRCFPTVVWPDAVLYAVFRDTARIIVVLHVTRIVVPRFPGQLVGARPELPPAAWKLAELRFEAHQW
jgi:hypothetical protein